MAPLLRPQRVQGVSRRPAPCAGRRQHAGQQAVWSRNSTKQLACFAVAVPPRQQQLAPLSGSGHAPGCQPGKAALRPARFAGRCRGFVGEGGSSTAGEYHCADFAWDSRVADGEAALARQLLEREEWLLLQQAGAAAAEHTQQAAAAAAEHTQQAAAAAAEHTQQAAAAAAEHTQQAAAAEQKQHLGHQQEAAAEQQHQHQQQALAEQLGAGRTPCPPEGAPDYDRRSWEGFHAQHSAARFFKERRYLLLEFPQLATSDPPQHFVEIGCGCGSSLLPVLRANPTCRVTGCDISPTAVRLFLEAAQRYGIPPERVSAFAFDAAAGAGSSGPSGAPLPAPAADSPAGSPFAGLDADAALLVFTLSALLPHEMPAMLRHATAALRPGGRLLLRDYGRWDMAQLRFPGSQMLGPHLYHRSDGTLAYFFTPEGLSELVAAAGLEVEACEYHCTALRNRKKGRESMKRVFVHLVARRPE